MVFLLHLSARWALEDDALPPLLLSGVHGIVPGCQEGGSLGPPELLNRAGSPW